MAHAQSLCNDISGILSEGHHAPTRGIQTPHCNYYIYIHTGALRSRNPVVQQCKPIVKFNGLVNMPVPAIPRLKFQVFVNVV